MKKFFTLCLGLMAAFAAQAQNEFPVQFADKDGNVIADGTELNLTNAIFDEDFGDYMLPSGLFVKNTSGNDVEIGGKYTISVLSNGAFQTCFPVNCVQKSQTGSFETGHGPLKAGELKDMLTEWMPAANGTCVVTYQLVTYQSPFGTNWFEDEEGPKVTLKFNFDLAGISSAKGSKTVSRVVYYDAQGRVVNNPLRGMFVQKTFYADGTQTSRKFIAR